MGRLVRKQEPIEARPEMCQISSPMVQLVGPLNPGSKADFEPGLTEQSKHDGKRQLLDQFRERKEGCFRELGTVQNFVSADFGSLFAG